ncbi:MAG: hypothetical protein R3F11_30480 [Verrucomicrobiales bacterium]
MGARRDAEVIAMDPELGAVFYHLKRHKGERPTELLRSQQCMDCHQGSASAPPRPLVRSVYPDSRGFPILSAAASSPPTTARCPSAGAAGASPAPTAPCATWATPSPNRSPGRGHRHRSRSQLRRPYVHFDTAKYLQPTSDIVALMVMEHQIGAHNLFNQGSYAVRSAIFRRKALDKELGDPTPTA